MSARYLGGVIAQTQLPLNPAAGNAANGVFTLNQYMQAVKNATWPGFDPYFKQNVLLLHGNGTNGAQNNTFLDSSTNNFTITRNGNTTQGTFSPFSLAAGEWSNYFNDNGKLTLASNVALNITGGAFTIEAWIYYTNTGTVRIIAAQDDGLSGGMTFQFRVESNDKLGFIYWTTSTRGSAVGLTSTNAITRNKWTHVAVTYTGSTVYMFIDGVQNLNTSVASMYANTVGTGIGGFIGSQTSNRFIGYISNLRIIKGTALYTSAFTPSTSPFTTTSQGASSSEVELLTCQSNRFIDNSTNAFAITTSGTPIVTPFSPFAPTAAYSAGTNGGSGYFDGNGDRLTFASNSAFAFGTGAYTVEAFVYLTAHASTATAVFTNGSATNALVMYVSTSGALLLGKYGVGDQIVSGTGVVTLNAWNHIAIVRTSTSSNDTRLYVNGTLVQTGTDSNDWTVTTTPTIGGLDVSGYFVNGYVANLRVVKGTAITPPSGGPTSPVTAVSGTSLLCNFTNAGIIDNTGKNNLETVGNAQIDTAVKKFGDGSMEFDGTGDWLKASSPDNYNFLHDKTSAYTIEAWIYPESLSGRRTIVLTGAASASSGVLFETDGTALDFNIYRSVSGSFTLATGGTLTINTWHHVAVSATTTEIKLFLDGVLIDTEPWSLAGSTANAQTSLTVGGDPLASDAGDFDGFIDDLRITKGIARYTSNFAVPYLPQGPLPLVGGPYIPNTVLMLPGTGTNGAQNNTFLDSSTNNFTITRNGNTTQGTFTPFSRANGYWGNYFDGNNDYLTTPSNSAFTLGTGNFTIEFWFWKSVNSTNAVNLIDFRTAEPSITPYLFVGGSTSAEPNQLVYYVNGATRIVTTTTPSTNQWYHVAVVRSSSVTKMYLNGTQVGSDYSDTNDYVGSSPTIAGRFAAISGDFRTWPGYLSNVRIVKGTAVYTSNFTPTGPLTAIANTSLLTCQSNRFVDNSTNNFTITRNGDVKVVTFSPFEYLTAYSPTTNGGSGYFDGSGDYLTVPDNAAFDFGTGDMTMEAWFYLTGNASTNIDGNRVASIYSSLNNGVTTNGFFLYIDGNGSTTGTAIGLLRQSTTSPTSGTVRATYTFDKNTWYHVAYVRSGGTNYMYVNGTSVTLTTNTIGSSDPLNGDFTVHIGDNANVDYRSYFPGYISNFRAVKGTAVYTSNFTPPTAPVTAIANTSLLCNFTNAGIYDASMSNDLETVGNAQVSTTQSKWGGGSMYFDGTGDYLLAPADQRNIEFLTGDFTIECWIRFAVVGNAQIITGLTAANTIYWQYFSSQLAFGQNNVANISATNWSPVANTWYHIAVTRSGTTVRQFVDGVQLGTNATSSASFPNGPIQIGSGGGGSLNGFISDLRILKGVAILPTPLQTSQWQDQ